MPPQPAPTPQPVPMPQPVPVPQPVPAPSPGWDSTGWTFLGEQRVDGGRDRDKIHVGRADGWFSRIVLVVEDSSLEMDDINVNFVGGGRSFSPNVRQTFAENSRSRVIDLPGDSRAIASIQFRYRNLPGGGKARVQVWGFRTAAPAPPAPLVVAWDNAGWTMLGERTVDGKRDRDTIKVDRDEGRFTKLTVVVLDSDLEMINMDLRFGNGESLSPTLAHIFGENSRTRVIDLPGNERTIKSINFRYRNLPGGGKARVQVWAKREGAVPMPSPLPPGQAWDPTGWTLLGEQTVNGSRDRDRIRVGRDEGAFRRLIVVVLDSDIDLVEMEVKFGKGKPFAPAVTHAFRENSRTRVIDLPGDQRVIKWIDFRYRNLPGGGRARVQAWAQ